jgi:hypothetical protein
MPQELDVEQLLFRRQYVLGPRPYERFASWKRVAIRPDVHLTAHPDLHVQQVVAGGKSLTLLGFILDSRDPRSDDGTVLEQFFLSCVPAATRDCPYSVLIPLAGAGS